MYIAICNEKGGVGKTTSTIQVASLLADNNHKTLIVDMDPQGHCALGLGLRVPKDAPTTYEVLVGDWPIADALQRLSENFYILPATKQLARAVSELQGQPGADKVLHEKLLAIAKTFEYVVIDCPPSLGILTINALTASQRVLIPIVPHMFPLEGTSMIRQTLELIQQRTNPALEILGVLPVMVERTNVMKDVLGAVKQSFGEKLVFTGIPKSTKYAEAQCVGQPLQHYTGYRPSMSHLLRGYQEIIETVEAN